jgi:hypothetical protein
MRTVSRRARLRAFSARGALPVLLIVLASVAVSALPSLAPSASAGTPPYLTTDPLNEVVVPFGQTSGTYVLKWNTGDGKPGQLWASVNNGPETGPSPVGPMDKTVLPIGVGDTVKWRLYHTDHLRVLAQVTITARRPVLCLSRCIKDVVVDPYGTFANVHVMTTTPVYMDLVVHEEGQGATVDQVSPKTDDWHTDLQNLKPNTNYVYTVKTTDEANNVTFWPGTFRTRHRKVEVNFESITVSDDTDDEGAGEFTFWFGLNNVWDYSNTYGEVNIDSDDTAHPFHTATIMDAPDSLLLSVYTEEDDCSGSCVSPGPSQEPYGWYEGGDTDDFQASTALTEVNVAATGLNEGFNGSTDFDSIMFVPDFTVHVSFTVSYVKLP